VLGSYLTFEPDVGEVCDCRCHYGLEGSNTDKTTSMTPLSYVDWHSIADNEIDAMATADVEVTECYCIVTLKQPTLVLKDCKILQAQDRLGSDFDYSQNSFAFDETSDYLRFR